MCQIIIKPKGLLTNLKNLDNAQERNHDGYGVMYFDGELKVFKSLDYPEFRNYIENVVTDKPAVIHLRFASRGKVSLDNVHPFITAQGAYLCHNGTLTSWGNAEVSDTQEFASTMKDLNIDWDSPAVATLLHHTIGTISNKIVIMKTDGKVLVFNKQLFVEEEGILYSNTNHHCCTPTYSYDPFESYYDDEAEYSYKYLPNESKASKFPMKVFVYGTLKKGESNNYFLETAKYIGKAETVSKYAMIDGEFFPYLLGYSKDGHYIKGEVYEVDEDTKEMLDILEGVPSLYVERKVFVTLEDTKKTVDCTLYMYAKTAHSPTLINSKYSRVNFIPEWTSKGE